MVVIVESGKSAWLNRKSETSIEELQTFNA